MKYLEEAIKSVLNQTYSNFEFLIINDGSTDGTTKVLSEQKKLDKRIKLIIHKVNKGLVYSLNEGIKEARGQYIARMDADDLSYPNRLREQLSYMNNHQDCDVCGTWAKAINENGRQIFDMKAPTGSVLKYNFWKPSPLIHPSICIKKSVISKYKFSAKFPRAEDYELWLRMGKAGIKMNNIPKYLLKYRINSNGISKSNQSEQKESSLNAFNANFNVEISLKQFLSLSSLKFEMGCLDRLKLLWRVKNNIRYPTWFMLIDNFHYGVRRLFFAIMPSLNRYK